MSENKGTNLAAGSLIILFGTIIARSFEYGTQIAVARVLGPVDYGLLTIGTSLLFGLTTLSVFGMDAALSRYIPYHAGRDEMERMNGVVTFGTVIPVLISLFLGVALFVSAPLLNDLIFNEENLSPVLRLFAPMIPLSTALLVNNASLRGFERMQAIALIDAVAWKATRLGLILVALYLSYELYGVLVGYLVSYVVAFCVSVWLLWRSIPAIRSIQVRNVVSEVVDFAKPMFASRLFGRGRREVDTIFIGALLTSGAVGVYNTAFTLSYILSIGLNSVNTALLPSLSDSYSSDNLDEFRSTYRLGARWSFYFTFPAFVFILIFPAEIIALFFGDQYRSAKFALVLLAGGTLASVLMGSVYEALTALGRTRMIMTFTFFSFVFNAIANYLLIQVFGIEGAAVATAGSLVLINSLAFVFLWRNYRVNPISTGHVWYTVSVGAAGILLYKIQQSIPDPGFLLFPIGGLAYLASFALMFLVDGLEPKDKEVVNQITRQATDYLFKI